MLAIQGALQVLPTGVSVEVGEMKKDGEATGEAQVVITFMSMAGPVQVVLPPDSIEGITNSLLDAAKKAAEHFSSNIIIAGADTDVKQMADIKQEIEKGKE